MSEISKSCENGAELRRQSQFVPSGGQGPRAAVHCGKEPVPSVLCLVREKGKREAGRREPLGRERGRKGGEDGRRDGGGGREKAAIVSGSQDALQGGDEASC